MKILLLGASGRTGRLVLEKALADGHEVTAIVRNPAIFGETKAELIAGTPYDRREVKGALKGCDAVISALNVSRKTESPWAKLRAPEDLISTSMGNVLGEAPDHLRIVVMSTVGAGDSWKTIPNFLKLLVKYSNLKYAFYDHTHQEQLLSLSKSDWTVVRLPMLGDGEGEKEVLSTLDNGTRINGKINRESAARFLLSILEEERYFRKFCSISN